MYFPLFLFCLFVGVTLVQLVVWHGLYGKLARYRPPVLAPNNRPVSVILCARNAAALLQMNLPAVLEQNHPDFEVLVVDDDSDDTTPVILKRFQDRYRHLRVLRHSPKTQPGKKAALSMGIRHARYEQLVFTDADCRPESRDWLHGLTQHWTPGIEIVLGYGPYYKKSGILNYWIRFETVHTAMQYFSMALAGRPYMGVGRNLAWNRSLFLKTGGFAAHEHLASGDDDLLVNAAGQAGNTAICLERGSFVFSEAETSWKNWWRQKQRHLSAGHFYRLQDKVWLGVLALSQALHYFLLTALLFTDFGTISAAFYAIRMASAFPVFRKILCRLREEQLLVWFPLFDALLAFYFAVFVPLNLLRPHYLISWK